ncbi:thioredoxin family protein [Sporosarcina sp. CAU 1771]
MKKLLIIGGVIVAVFILIAVLTTQSNKSKLENNPYGTSKLDPATIDLIGNEHYNNIILPEDLENKIQSGDSVTAYFFSPTCSYCKQMTPVLMPIANELNVEVFQYNLLEFSQFAGSYGLEGTPTLVHYKDGAEVDRLYGAAPEDQIRLFFANYESN